MVISRLKNLNKPKTIYGWDFIAVLCFGFFAMLGLVYGGFLGLIVLGFIGFSIGMILSPFFHNGKVIIFIYWYLPNFFLFFAIPPSEKRYWF